MRAAAQEQRKTRLSSYGHPVGSGLCPERCGEPGEDSEPRLSQSDCHIKRSQRIADWNGGCEGGPKKWKLFIKNYVYYYLLNHQSPSKYSPFDAIHLLRFFPCSKQYLNSLVLMPFSASASKHHLFTSATSGKCFPLRTFPSGETKIKVAWGEIRWIGRVGRRACRFWSKTL